MTNKGKLYWAKVAVVMGAIPLALWAYEYGPDAGYCGVPNELGTCTAVGCHTGTTNDPANKGSVKVNFPNGLTYIPGASQHLSVTIADPAPTQLAWGFQLTARPSSSPGTQAGTFASTDLYTGVQCAQPGHILNDLGAVLTLPGSQACPANMGLQYIEHDLAGYENTMGPGSGTYSFNWTPPATNVGNITIYVAGNAGVGGPPNANGDHIYTTTYTLTPAPPGPPPTISQILTASSEAPQIAQNTWVEIHGTNLSLINMDWTNQDFSTALPTTLAGVTATVGGKPAAIYYVSSTQINILAPLDSATGSVQIQVTTPYNQTTTATATELPTSPAFLYAYDYIHVAAQHLNYSLLGPTSLSAPGYTFTPAKPGETVVLYATGLGQTNPPITGQLNGVGPLPTLPTVTIGSLPATVSFAGLAGPGLYSMNVVVPLGTPNGDSTLTASYNGSSTQSNVKIAVQQ